MALANITVSVTEPNIAVSSDNVNVSVSSTTSNVTVGNAIITTDAEIRAALSNTSPILYNSTTGVISFDNSGFVTDNTLTINNTTTGINDTLTLGSNQTLTADAITEGNTNLFFTTTNFNTSFATKTTDNLTEGSTNLYHTTGRVHTAMPSYTGALTNLTGNISTTANIDAQGGMTLFGALTSNSNISTTANISGNFILGNISQVSGMYSDSDVISLFSNYANAISTESNVVLTPNTAGGTSKGTLIIGRTDNEASMMLTGGSGVSIGPTLANATATPIIEFLGTRLDANASPTTGGYGSGKITLNSEHIGGNNLLYLKAGKNQSNAGANNVGLQAEFYAQNTSGGTSGVYTDGGFRNHFTFFGDTRIEGPNNAGAYSDDDRQAIIEGFNINAWSLRSQSDGTIGRNLHAGANADSVHTFTGNVDITGNITATGNINYQNVTDLFVRDQSITLNANAATDATSSIIINRPQAGANTVLRWNETDDKWQFSNDGSTYQNLIGYTDFSVTTNSASGSGALSYSNTTGVFTFTPADISGLGITNAQAQAFIESNGLDMTANVTTNALISTTANIDSTKSINLTYPDTVLEGIKIVSDTSSSGLTILDVTSARSGDAGPQQFYRKSAGSIASPTAIGTRDYVKREKYFGHDGTDYLETMGVMVYQDSDVGSVSTNVVPLAYEIYTEQGGDVNHGFNQSIVRFDADRNIIFNDTGTRTFGNGQGNANIKMDGSINTVSNITATGNISGAHILVGTNIIGPGSGLTGLTSSQMTDFVSASNNAISANVGALTSAISSSENITTTANVQGAYVLGNGSALSSLTSSQITDFSSASNSAIAANLAALTSVISTTANIDTTKQINVDIPDSVTSVLKVEAETPSSGTVILDVTSARSADGGPQNEYKKATGTIASPGAIGTRDYVQRNLYYGHDGTDYINTFGTMVYQDSDVGGVSTGNVPLAYEIFSNLAGDSNDGFIQSIVRFDSNRNIIFNDNGTRTFGNGQGNANITQDGTINTVSNINATGNISGNYILGNGSQLTGVLTNTFNQILVSGQSNVDASGVSSLTLAESGDISITTDAANNKVTIGGSGGGFGNANVTTFLASATSVGNVAFTGNLAVESGNTSFSPSSYEGNVTSGDRDRIVFSSDPGFYDGQPVLFSGTLNSDLVFLNGNVFFVKGAGISNTYDLFTDAGLTTGLQSGLGTESPNSLAASARNESNNKSDFFGNVNISRGSTLNCDNLKPFTPGGTFRLSSLRADDVGLGSGGTNFFFPETGGNTEGGILHAHSDNVGTWEDGIRRESDNSVDIIESKIYRNGSNGTAMDFYKAGGSQASPTAPGSNDYIVQMDCFLHDGTQFLNAAGYHVYQDGDSGSVGTNDTPVSHEFYVKKDQTGFQKSVMKLTADQKIIFNDTGVRSFGNYKGTANISADGSFHTAGDVTIDGRLKLPTYTTTEVNALSSPAAGDVVFNTTENTICFYNGSAWHKVTSTAL
tara:strand:- start:4503 stop:8948 length:4446 start_codon:yes stop_codon:yes gene_type:complete